MDFGLLIPIVAIVMGISIPITAIKLRHKERIEQMRLAAATSGNRDSGTSDRQAARIEELEDRMAVLERIITDSGVSVAAQIEALRDRDVALPLQDRAAAR
jgi:hypothetical protein